MPKPTRRALAVAVSGAVAVGSFGIASTAFAVASATGSVTDSCGTDDTLELSGAVPGQYTVSFTDSRGIVATRSYKFASLPVTISRRAVTPVLAGPVKLTVTESASGDDVVLTNGLQRGTVLNLTDLKCAYPQVTYRDQPGVLNDTITIPNTAGVTYLRDGVEIAPGIHKAVGNVVITTRAKDGYVLVNRNNVPIDYTFDMTFGGLSTVTIPADRVPRLITDPDGDVVRIYNVAGVVWTVDGKSVQVTGKDSYKEFPVTGKGSVNVIAAPATPDTTSLAGQYEWDFGTARVVTIAKDKVPTASDQAGSKSDAVILSNIPGVKWRVGSKDIAFPAGDPIIEVPTGGATNVRVIALPASSTYRMSGTSTWNLTFKTGLQVTIPASKLPVANDQSGTANDSVTVFAVDGITWTVGSTEVVFDKGETSKTIPTGGLENVTVTASLATGGTGTGSGKSGLASTVDTELAGQNSWDMLFNTAVRSISARPSVAARSNEAGITPRQSLVRWATPRGLKAPATYDVAFRIVNVTAAGKRVPGSWKPWLGSTKATSAVFTGLPGGVYEVSVRATGADGTVSAWSAPSRVIVPLDIRRPGGRTGAAWKLAVDKTAASSTLLVTATRGATWATVTPATDRIMAWVGTGPTNGYVNVLVDGKLRARINTWSARPHARQMLVNLPVEWGKHRLAFVNAPVGKRAVTKLDALAYNR